MSFLCNAALFQHWRDNTPPPLHMQLATKVVLQRPIYLLRYLQLCTLQLAQYKWKSVTSHHKYACAMLVFGMFPLFLVTCTLFSDQRGWLEQCFSKVERVAQHVTSPSVICRCLQCNRFCPLGVATGSQTVVRFSAGFAIFVPQEGHITPEGRTSVYIYRK